MKGAKYAEDSKVAAMVEPADQLETCRHCFETVGELDHIWQHCHVNSHLRAERQGDIGEIVKSGLLRAEFEKVPSNPAITDICWPVISALYEDVVLISSVQIVGEFKDLEEAYKSLTVKLENEQSRSWAALNCPQHTLKFSEIVLNYRGAWAKKMHKDLTEASDRRSELDLISMEVVRRATVL